MITILPTPVTYHRCLNTNYRSITCLKSNYFLKFWQGANNFVHPILEFCVKFYQILLFFFFFLCCCSGNKNNKHVNTKTFAIGTIFWEKCCIFWQNCKGADIFGHDCNAYLEFLNKASVSFTKPVETKWTPYIKVSDNLVHSLWQFIKDSVRKL